MPAGPVGDLGVNELIRLLGLGPHPQAGCHRQVWPADAEAANRPSLSVSLHLLRADEVMAWHRLDTDQVWLWQAGGPLCLTSCQPDGSRPRSVVLSGDLRSGQRPQAVVCAGQWQTAETLGAWTLLSSVLSTGAHPPRAEPAPPDWRPQA